jgi:hypothetical protein
MGNAMLRLCPADGMDGIVDAPGGRGIAYREYGHPRGVPVVFYHGALSSRL